MVTSSSYRSFLPHPSVRVGDEVPLARSDFSSLVIPTPHPRPWILRESPVFLFFLPFPQCVSSLWKAVTSEEKHPEVQYSIQMVHAIFQVQWEWLNRVLLRKWKNAVLRIFCCRHYPGSSKEHVNRKLVYAEGERIFNQGAESLTWPLAYLPYILEWKAQNFKDTHGWQWPTPTVTIPEKKSRYLFPS